MSFLGGRGGWTGREETVEGLCSLLFPGKFPIPDGCQALADRCAEDAVVPRWGDAPCEEAAAGNPTGVRVAHQVTFASSSSPERAPVFGCRRFHGAFRRVRLDRKIVVPATGDQTFQLVC